MGDQELIPPTPKISVNIKDDRVAGSYVTIYVTWVLG